MGQPSPPPAQELIEAREGVPDIRQLETGSALKARKIECIGVQVVPVWAQGLRPGNCLARPSGPGVPVPFQRLLRDSRAEWPPDATLQCPVAEQREPRQKRAKHPPRRGGARRRGVSMGGQRPTAGAKPR
uniref:Uncharacterized protein n=1 Tax=Eutreptiella gymnastica TaxID=73025 RepID=A0A7S4LHQ9_9EUGL|mmetsp:Transcript_90662/g.151726  ORF Transcript_90662/g.151726 Transcript_90662/m.151726 type:complete len:130 (-) Transcript_90662:1356-1745(-)